MQEKDARVLSVQGVKRLPYYLKLLKELITTVGEIREFMSAMLAKAMVLSIVSYF